MAATFNEDIQVNGTLRATAVILPAGAVTDAAIQGLAGIAASKLVHRFEPTYSQPNTTATSETRMIHTVYGTTATVLAFKAGSIAICVGAATITVDLKKNGSSVLSAVITLDSGNTSRVVEAATVTTPAGVTGDVYEIVIVATAGGGTIGTGLFCSLVLNEDAQ